MSTATILNLLERAEELLVRTDQLLLGRVLVATQEYSAGTADEDPGEGRFQLNNATLANVTEGYFDIEAVDGTSLAPLLDTYDDSSSGTKGILILQSNLNVENWASYAITGTVIDGGGYRNFTLSHITSSGDWGEGELFSQTFYRTGDKGDTGASAYDIAVAEGFEGTRVEWLASLTGPMGSAPNLSVGTVQEGEAAVEIAGDSPNYTLNFTLPAGPPPDLTIGTVSVGEAAVSITGTSPDYTLNFTLPTPQDGEDGDDGASAYQIALNGGFSGTESEWLESLVGPPPELTIGTVSVGVAGVEITGDSPDYTMNITLPTPQDGEDGDDGADGRTIHTVSGAPASGLGQEGDYAYDPAAADMYGPKGSGGWPATPTSLIGPAGEGSGNVNGPASATNNHLVAFDGATGTLIKSAGVTAMTLQNGIVANGDAIIALQGQDATHTAGIAANVSDINAHETRLDNAEDSITDHGTRLSQAESDIDDAETAIASHGTRLDDAETAIASQGSRLDAAEPAIVAAQADADANTALITARTGPSTIVTASATLPVNAPRILIDTDAGDITATLPDGSEGDRIEWVMIGPNVTTFTGSELTEDITVSTPNLAGIFFHNGTNWEITPA